MNDLKQRQLIKQKKQTSGNDSLDFIFSFESLFSFPPISVDDTESPDEYVDLTAIVTGIAFDIIIMVFRLILFIDLNRQRMEKRHNNQSKK